MLIDGRWQAGLAGDAQRGNTQDPLAIGKGAAMQQIMVTILEADRAIHAEVHEGLADITLGALSAEPETLDELRTAMQRFVEPPVADFLFEQAEKGIARRPAEGGQMLFSLPARLLVNATSAPEIPRLGRVQRCDQFTTLDDWLPYRVPDDWQLTTEIANWQQLAAERCRQRADHPPIDARAVLYGKLADCLVHRWEATTRDADRSTIGVQTWWLLTPRDDLRGKTPRELLMARRRFIDGDIQDMASLWTRLGRCPPGILPEAAAYRLGGFGSKEIIIYHEMVAHLLDECARRMPPGSRVDLAAEVRQLEQLQQEWLHQTQETLYDQSPAAVIARERARLPSVVPSGRDCIDDDCPLCRMMAESDAPVVWHLDSFHLDDEFATSLYDTREEWELVDDERQQIDREFEQVIQNDSDITEASDGAPRIWQNTYSNMDLLEEMPPAEAVAVLLFSIGGHLAELIQDLRGGSNADQLVAMLHDGFDTLRVTLKDGDQLFVIQQRAGEFVDVLNAVAEADGNLQAKCLDLENKTDVLCRYFTAQFDQDQEAAY